MKPPSIIFTTLAVAAPIAADQAGDFDYYVLALSWNAGYCALENGDLPEICDKKYDYGFRLHGLWPQNTNGYPEFCQSSARNPSRQETAARAELFGSAGFAWHQWNKHGRCSGLSAAEYYDQAGFLFERFAQPEIFRQIDRPFNIDADVIEQAVIEANPALFDAAMAVTCRDDVFYELRICLDRNDFHPIPCAGALVRDCPGAPEFLPIR